MSCKSVAKLRRRRWSRRSNARLCCRVQRGSRNLCSGGDSSSKVSDKLEALRSLIPVDNGDIKTDQLFQETADYIILLRKQVVVLQRLIQFYGSGRDENADTTFCYAMGCDFLELHGPGTEFSINEQLIQLVLNFLSLYDPSFIWFKLQSHPREITDVSVVKDLVGKVRPAEEEDSMANPSMAEFRLQWLRKAGNRGMAQYLLLRRPAHHY